MARAHSPASADPNDAIALLQRDHRLIELLFQEYELAQGLQREPVARRICKILSVHAEIEEELFYPVARAAIHVPGLIEEAEIEHAHAKHLIARIDAMAAGHGDLDAAVRELGRVVQEHVEEEEQQIFPRLAEAKTDLRALGLALAGRRATLLDIMGLHEEDEQPALPAYEERSDQASTGPAAREFTNGASDQDRSRRT